MAGLVIKLGPRERLLLNGAVVENGDRRTRLSVLTPNTNVLRMKDAMRPEEAQTPVRRICYISQLALSGDAAADKAKHQILLGIEQLSQVLRDDDSRSILGDATHAVLEHDFYKTLRLLRSLIDREARLLNLSH